MPGAFHRQATPRGVRHRRSNAAGLSPRAARYLTDSESETEHVGTEVAGQLAPGAVVLLHGELGAGKTAFVRGMAVALGIDPREVSSPTFTLIQEYRGRLRLEHVDLYRVSGREIDDLGLEELVAEDAIVVIEWADRLAAPIGAAHTIRIVDHGGDRREILVAEGHSAR